MNHVALHDKISNKGSGSRWDGQLVAAEHREVNRLKSQVIIRCKASILYYVYAGLHKAND